MKKIIVFDIGGTIVKHGLINNIGEFVEKGTYPTNRLDSSVFLNDLTTMIQKYKANYRLDGIAISLPGIINPYTGYSEYAGAIECLNGKNLKEILDQQFHIPIVIENDANCVALAEMFSGNALGCENFICLTIGTGIGGGIVHNGKLIRGQSFRGGEFGYMITRPDLAGYETLNDNASMKGLICQYKKLKGIDFQEIVQGDTIFEASYHDQKVKELLNQWYKNIGIGIFNLVATLNPEKVLIGGGVSAQVTLLESVVNEIESLDWWKYINVPIDICKHRNDSGMLGAFCYFKSIYIN